MALRIAVLGYGVRGRVYVEYARSHPDVYEVVAIGDTSLGVDWREALEAASSAGADAAIVALPDKLHRDAAVAALSLGLHVLLEKPVGCSWQECLDVREAAAKARRLVLTCYVLRFARYYRRLREILRTGVIGDIVSIHHLVAIGYGKAAHAFCRGNWAREADGTSTLVQKCTHDFDLIAWWTGGRKIKRIASYGSLVHWRPEARPPGAAERCLDCPASVRSSCPFDAVRLYLEEDALRYHFAERSDEAMRKVLAGTNYGKCVYDCGNDAVNRQSVLMEFEGGIVATLEMEAFTKDRARRTRFCGTRGEVLADGEKIVVRPFIGGDSVFEPHAEGAHGGGDREIMVEFARLATSASPERYLPLLDAALESHYAAFLAEKSRLSDC